MGKVIHYTFKQFQTININFLNICHIRCVLSHLRLLLLLLFHSPSPQHAADVLRELVWGGAEAAVAAVVGNVWVHQALQVTHRCDA